MRILSLLLLSFGFSALAQEVPSAQTVAQTATQPVQDEEPIWLGDTPPGKTAPLPPPPAKTKGKAAVTATPPPANVVIYHWVDAEGIDTYSDEVPPLYKDKAALVTGELAILRWST
jgi:hypothetical protein